MHGKWMFRFAAFSLMSGCFLAATGLAAPPWAKLMNVKSVDTEPDKEYLIKEENGPWMIMACSFTGPDAQKQAHELVLELRKKHKVEAYVHKVQFKLDDPNAAQGNRSPIRWQYRRSRENANLKANMALEEVAVLVGNYATIDDPDGQKMLQKLKIAQPDCLKMEEGKQISRPLAALRMLQQAVMPEGSEKKNRGPMGHAFVTTNPILPADYYAPKGIVDELVLKMNKGVTHSLLDCPGRYTVQVAHFTGEVILDQKEIQEIEKGKQVKSSLMEAAEKAHDLTEALRMKGYEAYEFHDRYASIVCVGSFTSVGTPRNDGKTEINPKVLAIMKNFGGEPLKIPGQPSGTMALKDLAGIPFDIQPIPVEVPKRSISRELARRVVDED